MTVKPKGPADQPGTQLTMTAIGDTAAALQAELAADEEVANLIGEDLDEDDDPDEVDDPPPATATPPAPTPPAATPVAAPAAGTPPAGPAPLLDDEDRADGIAADGEEFVRVPASKFRSMKARARAQGATTATAEAAQRHGFTDLDDALAKLKALAAQTQTPNPQDPTMTKPSGKFAALKDKARKALKDLQSQHASQLAAKDQEIATLKAEQATREKAAKEAQTEIEIKATLKAAGFVDDDYAMSLFRKEVAGKKDEEIAAFIAGLPQWATSVKASKPYLFGETAPAPAQTAPPAGAPTQAATPPGAPPQTPPATPPATAPATVNARDMSKADFSKALRERGLSVSGSVPVGNVIRSPR